MKMKIKKYGDLKHMMISLTHRCNFNCRICDIPDIKIEELQPETVKLVLTQAIDLGATTFTLSGGEPLIFPGIFEIIEFLGQKNLETRLCSNGWLINKKVAKRLKECNLYNISLSLEGPREIHDYIRKKGSFDQLLKAISNLQSFGFWNINLATEINKLNLDKLEYVVEFASKYHIPSVTFQPFSAMFFKEGGTKEVIEEFYIRNVKGLSSKIEKLIKLAKKKRVNINSQGYLRNIPNYFEKKKFNFLCLAPFHELCMYPNGKIVPCWEMCDVVLGNIKKESLKQIFYSKKRKKFLEAVIKGNCSCCLLSCNYLEKK